MEVVNQINLLPLEFVACKGGGAQNMVAEGL